MNRLASDWEYLTGCRVVRKQLGSWSAPGPGSQIRGEHSFVRTLTTMSVIEAVLSQHSDEASFLWLQRRSAVAAPHYSLSDLANLDGRVEAHLDGLRIAGEEGWKLCEERLAANEEGEVFVAGVIAMESAKPELLARVLAVVEAEPKLIDGLISALGWLPFERVESACHEMIEGGNSVRQRVGLGALIVHGRNPAPFLSVASCSQDVQLKAQVLKAAGQFQDSSLKMAINDSLADTEVAVKFAAAWSATLLGSADALPVLRKIAESDPRYSLEAAMLAARRLNSAEAAAWRAELIGDPSQQRLAINVAAAAGDPIAVPWLLSLMNNLPLARLAGEAFTLIAGVDLAYCDLERKPPEGFNAGPTEDPNDENVEMDADDNLPWPDPTLVQRWWEKNRGQFQNGTRYLMGKPMTIDWLKIVLRDGRQRQRAAAALELAIRQPGVPLFNVKAPGFRQIQLLGKPGPLGRE